MSIVFSSRQAEMLKVLNSERVRYLVVGGHAVIAHGYQRPAKDVDIWLAPSEENAQALARAVFSYCGLRLTATEIETMSRPATFGNLFGAATWTSNRTKRGMLRLDPCLEIFTSVPCRSAWHFDEVARRSKQTFKQGASFPVLGLRDLIQSKQLPTSRPGDHEDVRQLRRLHQMVV